MSKQFVIPANGMDLLDAVARTETRLERQLEGLAEWQEKVESTQERLAALKTAAENNTEDLTAAKQDIVNKAKAQFEAVCARFGMTAED